MSILVLAEVFQAIESVGEIERDKNSRVGIQESKFILQWLLYDHRRFSFNINIKISFSGWVHTVQAEVQMVDTVRVPVEVDKAVVRHRVSPRHHTPSTSSLLMERATSKDRR